MAQSKPLLSDNDTDYEEDFDCNASEESVDCSNVCNLDDCALHDDGAFDEHRSNTDDACTCTHSPIKNDPFKHVEWDITRTKRVFHFVSSPKRLLGPNHGMCQHCHESIIHNVGSLDFDDVPVPYDSFELLAEVTAVEMNPTMIWILILIIIQHLTMNPIIITLIIGM
eukprot:791334_1